MAKVEPMISKADSTEETIMATRAPSMPPPVQKTYLPSSVIEPGLPSCTGNDKPLSHGTPAGEQVDAWTAYKTKRGAVFYYNAVTEKITREEPDGFEDELSMDVKDCYACLIKGLPKSATTEQVRKIFSRFGRILDAMVLMDYFNNVSMGIAYVIYETIAARKAAMGCSGMFFGPELNMIAVTDAQGFGTNAYEVEDGQFDVCITIGEDIDKRPTGEVGSKYAGGGSGRPVCGESHPREGNIVCGESHPREGNMDACNLEGSPKRRRYDRP